MSHTSQSQVEETKKALDKRDKARLRQQKSRASRKGQPQDPVKEAKRKAADAQRHRDAYWADKATQPASKDKKRKGDEIESHHEPHQANKKLKTETTEPEHNVKIEADIKVKTEGDDEVQEIKVEMFICYVCKQSLPKQACWRVGTDCKNHSEGACCNCLYVWFTKQVAQKQAPDCPMCHTVVKELKDVKCNTFPVPQLPDRTNVVFIEPPSYDLAGVWDFDVKTGQYYPHWAGYRLKDCQPEPLRNFDNTDYLVDFWSRMETYVCCPDFGPPQMAASAKLQEFKNKLGGLLEVAREGSTHANDRSIEFTLQERRNAIFQVSKLFQDLKTWDKVHARYLATWRKADSDRRSALARRRD